MLTFEINIVKAIHTYLNELEISHQYSQLISIH
jgi:hypothetical protein